MTAKRKIEPIEAWAIVARDGKFIKGAIADNEDCAWRIFAGEENLGAKRSILTGWGCHAVKVRIVPDEPCVWWLDDEEGGRFWANCTDETFGFGDGGPADNGFRFCPYCGRRIEEAV